MTAFNQSAKFAKDPATNSQVSVKKDDTTGLSAFQDWQIRNELAEESNFKNSEKNIVAAPARRSVAKAVPVRTVTRSTPKPKSAAQPAAASNSGTSDVANTGTMSNESAEAAKALEEKKGMSKAAKGAIIGGVGGAVAGAVINKKNRTAGAVVGAVIGAGGGYVVGRQADKKDGRIEIQ